MKLKNIIIFGKETPFNKAMLEAVTAKAKLLMDKDSILYPILVAQNNSDDQPTNYFQDKPNIEFFINQIISIFEPQNCLFIFIYEPNFLNYKVYIEEINQDTQDYKIIDFMNFLKKDFLDNFLPSDKDSHEVFESAESEK